jgi:hypothetical protein
MTIELSDITFTIKADVIPPFGVENILNTGITNTLAGNDIIKGDSNNTIIGSTYTWESTGLLNSGTLNTSNGNDILTGIFNNQGPRPKTNISTFGIRNAGGTIDTGDGNDIIKGITQIEQDVDYTFNAAILNDSQSTIYTGNGNDIIIGIHKGLFNGDGLFGKVGYGIINSHSIDTGSGNDTITGLVERGTGISSGGIGTINTGDGNDIIEGTAIVGQGIFLNHYNEGTDTSSAVDTGRGNDIIAGTGNTVGLEIYTTITTGDGNDTISGTGGVGEGFYNATGSVYTGDGNDIITGSSRDSLSISNGNQYRTSSIIDTGDGNDVITGISGFGIYNSGIIKTGNGNDSLIAEASYSLDFRGEGSVFLENGKDFLKGFGQGIFNGGNGEDTLEFTIAGSYTIGISGTTVNFFASQFTTTMQTSDFEILIAGGTTYDFSSLTDGQIITIPYPSI